MHVKFQELQTTGNLPLFRLCMSYPSRNIPAVQGDPGFCLQTGTSRPVIPESAPSVDEWAEIGICRNSVGADATTHVSSNQITTFSKFVYQWIYARPSQSRWLVITSVEYNVDRRVTALEISTCFYLADISDPSGPVANHLPRTACRELLVEYFLSGTSCPGLPVRDSLSRTAQQMLSTISVDNLVDEV